MSSPVIILGAARSGTKFLRDLIGTSPGVPVVPHDVNYVWRHGNESYPSDELPVSRYDERIGRFIRRRLAKLAGAGEDSDDLLVEKTVSNTLRVDFVRAVYPRARLIHLVRDGRAVVESSMRQWRERPDWRRLAVKALTVRRADLRYALWVAGNLARGRARGRGGGHVWGPRYEGIDDDISSLPLLEVCARQWSACVERTLEGLERAPLELVHTIRYEDLVRGTEALERLTRFLALPDPDPVLERYREARIPDTDRKWQAAFSAEEQDQVARVVGPVMDRLGYPI